MAWAIWLTLGGCAQEPPPPQAVGCDVYVGDIDLAAACVRLEALQQETPRGAERTCDRLPPPRNVQCRTEWVASMSDHPYLDRDELLSMCAGAPDCRFGVLDARPAGTYAAEAQECVALTGQFAPDCVGHAAQRLLRRTPDDQTLRAAAALPHGERLAGMVPGYLACTGRTVCPDLGRWTHVCTSTLASQPALACANTPPTAPPPGP
jgi:hypothetical protein